MAEDAGKKDDIREFLERVNNGVRFIEDIWIERDVKQRGSEGKFNEARSLSGRPVSNITELLTDDLRHSFDDGSFTFRFVAAVPGSGKTTLLDYLRELIEVEPRYRRCAIVVQFPFNELLSESGNESFGVKFYAYTLTQTFWELMRDDNTSLSADIRGIAEKFLSKIIGKEKVAQLKLTTDFEMGFIEQLNEYISEKKINFKKLFFSSIKYFLQADSQVSFVYLMDELDALQSHQNYLQDARSIVRDLINEALGGGKIRLMIYMVGVSDDVETFIKADHALYSRVFDSVINLVAYRREECEKIRSKIEERIEGAYSGCKDFDKAWQEIKNIQLEPAHDYSNLREFCKKLSGKVIEIHERYFHSFDKSFNKFEGKARQLVEVQARKKWSAYLGDYLTEETSTEQRLGHLGHTKCKRYKGKNGFVLLVATSTTVIKNHAVDCYAELWHNGHEVAKVYGEAKNYSLTKEHIDTFQQWLTDFKYEPISTDGNPPDLAFIVSPSCTSLQQRKLKIKSIEFIEVEKIIEPTPLKIEEPEIKGNSSVGKISVVQHMVSINKADKNLLINALKGTGIRKPTVDKLIDNRPYNGLEDLATKIKFSKSVKDKLEAKVSSGEICFD
jgi:DNA uptake protein ComE-like DNA-binding protein